MIILYILVMLLTLKMLFKGYGQTRELMESVRNESGEISMTWVRIMLFGTWFLIVFLVLYAKAGMRLPGPAALAIICLKLPAFGLANYFFEKGAYTKTVFAADKLDQWTNMALCGYALYFTFVSGPA